MIFPNAQGTASAINNSQLFNPGLLPFQIGYAPTQINYRDSSWLKLGVCEMFLNGDCPNIDNCSLAHPPNNVKIDNKIVTVCYDYIKKKDCKHNNCKYYHPHDALSSAILRRGDDSKKNGAFNNLGLPVGLPNHLPINRSQNFVQLPRPNLLSSQLNTNDQLLKSKLESVTDTKKVRTSNSAEPIATDGMQNINATPTTTMLPNALMYNMNGLYPPVGNSGLNPSLLLQPQHQPVTTTTPLINSAPINLDAIMAMANNFQNNPIQRNVNLMNLYQQALYNNSNVPCSTSTTLFPTPSMPQTLNYMPSVNTAGLQFPTGTVPTNSGGINSYLYYPNLSNPMNMFYQVPELQQRMLEETSVAYINDKGVVLETLPVCKDFLQGKCKRAQSCNYVHMINSTVEVKDGKCIVCKNALKGQCHRQICKFYHIPTYQLQKLNMLPVTTNP